MPTRNTTGNEDFQYVKCTNCGFPCKLGRDKIREGNGNSYYELSHTQTQAPDDWTVSFGCPQCGRGNYTK
jgi:hypothetical protein